MKRKIKKYAPDEDRPKGRRADGRLSKKITVGHDAEGNPIHKYAYGYTKAERDAKAEEIKKKYITGNTSTERDILFGVYALRWFQAYIISQKLSDSGENDYINALNQHILPVFGDRQIRAIMPMDIMEFLNSKADKSQSLVNKLYMVLKQIFDMALGQYIIDRSPMVTVKRPVAHEGKRRALTEAERKAVLYVGKNNLQGLLLLILYYTGIRIGEALGLQWQDIDYKKREINICRDIDFNARKKVDGKINYVGDLKSDAAYRKVPIPKPLYSALNKCTGIGSAFVLQGKLSGEHLSQSSYQRLWERLMVEVYKKDISIEHRDVTQKDKPKKENCKGEAPKQKPQRSILTPHYFRHNFATLLYDAGVDLLTAIKIFGHKDKKILIDIYTELSKKKEQESISKLDHIFK